MIWCRRDSYSRCILSCSKSAHRCCNWTSRTCRLGDLAGHRRTSTWPRQSIDTRTVVWGVRHVDRECHWYGAVPSGSLESLPEVTFTHRAPHTMMAVLMSVCLSTTLARLVLSPRHCYVHTWWSSVAMQNRDSSLNMVQCHSTLVHDFTPNIAISALLLLAYAWHIEPVVWMMPVVKKWFRMTWAVIESPVPVSTWHMQISWSDTFPLVPPLRGLYSLGIRTFLVEKPNVTGN